MILKRIIALLLCAIMLFCLCACSIGNTKYSLNDIYALSNVLAKAPTKITYCNGLKTNETIYYYAFDQYASMKDVLINNLLETKALETSDKAVYTYKDYYFEDEDEQQLNPIYDSNEESLFYYYFEDSSLKNLNSIVLSYYKELLRKQSYKDSYMYTDENGYNSCQIGFNNPAFDASYMSFGVTEHNEKLCIAVYILNYKELTN